MLSVALGLSMAVYSGDSARVDSLQLVEIHAVSSLGLGQSARNLGSGTHVEARVLRQTFTQNPNEAASTVPGLTTRDEDGFGLRMNWGIRGTGTERSSRVVLMEDGVLTAPAPYSAPAAYYQPSVLRMSGLEVAKGSSQIAAGPQTTGGAINFQSSPIDLQQRIKVRSSLGGYGTAFAHSQVSLGGPPWAASVEWLRQHSNGFRQLDGRGPGGTGFDLNEWVAKSQLRINRRNTLLFKALVKGEESAQSYLGLTEADFAVNPYRLYGLAQKDVLKSRFGQAWVRHLYRGAQTELSTTAYAQGFGRNWYKLDGLSAEGEALTSLGAALRSPSLATYRVLTLDSAGLGRADVKANNRSYASSGIQTHGLLRQGPLAGLRFGARLHRDYGDQLQWTDRYDVAQGQMHRVSHGSPGSAGNQRLTTTAGSAYAEARLRRGKWTAVPGLRVESIYSRNEKWSALDSLRLGTADRTAAWTTVALPGLRLQRRGRNHLAFASVHRGFASGSASADVRAEHSVNAEWGLQAERRNLDGMLTAFATWYQNMLGSDLAASGGSGTGDLFNAGSARILGLEAAGRIRQRWGRMALEHQIQASWMHSAFTSAFKATTDVWREVAVGDPIPYTPQLQGNARSEARLGRWGFIAQVQYTGASATGLGGNLPARTLVHGGIFVEPAPAWRIQLDGSNLTGSRVAASLHPAGWRVTGPRMLRFGVSYGW